MGSQQVEEWARSKHINFCTGAVTLAQHFVLLNTHLTTAPCSLGLQGKH